MLQAFASLFQPAMTVWFGARGLLREMSVQLSFQVQLGGKNDSVGGDVTMDFSNYGAPVRIAAPAASDTISYDSFLQTLGTSTS